jgi:hypothetical protein
MLCMQGTTADDVYSLGRWRHFDWLQPKSSGAIDSGTTCCARFRPVDCPKGRVLGGIGGQNENFLQKGGIVGIFCKIKDTLVKKSIRSH